MLSIYLITNLTNGKRYIGQTRQALAKRWEAHCYKNRCKCLYNAIKKHGKESFSMERLIEVPTRDLANQFEVELIERYRTLAPNGYNICLGGDDRTLCFVGRKHSEEAKRKMRFAKLGKPSGRKGRPLSDEQKDKLRRAHRGKVLSASHRANMAIAQQARRLREANANAG